jgi:hypothetical protein
MAKYDDASWHYGGDFPENLPAENGATHIGMFLTWCVENNFMSDFQIEESEGDIEAIKKRIMTGAEFLMTNCDGKFTDEDLNDLGNQFGCDYYGEDTPFSKNFSSYLNDYQDSFEKAFKNAGLKFDSIYHLEDNWDNYDIIKPIIDKRFTEWREFSNPK